MAPSKRRKIDKGNQGKSKKVLLGVKGSDVKVWYLGDRRKKKGGSSRKQKCKRLSCTKKVQKKCTRMKIAPKCKREYISCMLH